MIEAERSKPPKWKNATEQVITQPQELTACCEHVAACGCFGLDTEFVGEDSYHPRLCLIQVATSEKLFLIDPLSVGSLDAFWKLVVDPANLVIVHAGREEVRLCHLWSGQTPGNLFDLQIAAGLVGLPYPLGHGNLVSQVLRVQIAKGETLTEWRNRPLTKSQIRYAFDDVRYLLPLWEHLSGRLQRLDRLSWAAEEFAHLKDNATPEEPSATLSNDRWRKLRGLGTLDRRRLAVVRELYAWREEEAARANRPPRTILRDDLLIEIAKRGPTKERDLQVMRGLARKHLSAILQAVERGRAVPLHDCPKVVEREVDIPQVNLVVHLLSAVLGDLCARLQIAPSLVANSQDVRLLARARYHGQPLPAESALSQGWRAAHILPELQAILDGRRSVHVGDIVAAAPLGYIEAEAGGEEE